MVRAVKVYREARELATQELCDLGCKHTVRRYTAKTLTDTGDTRAEHDGYNAYTANVFEDARGRRYVQLRTPDYGEPYFMMLDKSGDKVPGFHFSTERRVDRPARDLFGKTI